MCCVPHVPLSHAESKEEEARIYVKKKKHEENYVCVSSLRPGQVMYIDLVVDRGVRTAVQRRYMP